MNMHESECGRFITLPRHTSMAKRGHRFTRATNVIVSTSLFLVSLLLSQPRRARAYLHKRSFKARVLDVSAIARVMDSIFLPSIHEKVAARSRLILLWIIDK